MSDPRGTTAKADAAIPVSVAVLTDALPPGADRAAAIAAIRLVTLAAGGAAGPVALTPDELGAAWSDGTLRASPRLERNGQPEPAVDATCDLASSVTAAARSAGLAAGGFVAVPAGEAVALRAGDTLRVELRDLACHSIFGAIEQTVTP